MGEATFSSLTNFKPFHHDNCKDPLSLYLIVGAVNILYSGLLIERFEVFMGYYYTFSETWS